MPITPFIRSPFTDLTGSLINHQTYDKCGELEMNMMDCLEAYGAERGKSMCKDLVDDFNECFTMQKQMLRFQVSEIMSKFLVGLQGKFPNEDWARLEAMRSERMKQYWNGQRKKEELFAEPPRVDAY